MPIVEERRGPIWIVTISRPESLNAIDSETSRELVESWIRFRDDDSLRVAIVRGAGERAFSAGMDVKKMRELYSSVPPEKRREVWSREPGLGGITRNLDPGKPVVAAIHGYCYGGGLELALACDIRIASTDALFALPEVNWGIIPGQGGTQRLPRILPPNIALEMILTGEPIPASRAYELGLVNAVVERERLLERALEVAEKIAQKPPKAVRTAREAVLRGLDLPLPQGLQLEQDLADPLRGGRENLEAWERSLGSKKVEDSEPR